MIKTTATFESQHKYTKELQRDLEEMRHKGLPIPETVEVSPGIFMAMCQEGKHQGARVLHVAVGYPVDYWKPTLYPDLNPPCTVRVVPK